MFEQKAVVFLISKFYEKFRLYNPNYRPTSLEKCDCRNVETYLEMLQTLSEYLKSVL